MDIAKISPNDALTALEIVSDLNSAKTLNELNDIFEKTKRIIPFSKALYCCKYRVKNNGNFQYTIINLSYPSEWMENYVKNEYHLVDPVYLRNMTEFGLQRWKDTYKKITPPQDFASGAADCGLNDGFTFGLPDTKGHFASLFSMAEGDLEYNEREKSLLKILYPVFHNCLSRLTPSLALKPGLYGKIETDSMITERELEVLKWIGEGKSNWDIGTILTISEDTVKFHIKNLIRRLSVVNRTHLVSTALAMKLI